MARRLVVQLVADPADSERVAVGLSVAAAAAAAGTAVSLWLAGECVWLAVPEQRRRFEPEDLDLFDGVLDMGQVSVCSRCAARRGVSHAQLIPGVRVRGAAEFAEEATAGDAQALVY